MKESITKYYTMRPSSFEIMLSSDFKRNGNFYIKSYRNISLENFSIDKILNLSPSFSIVILEENMCTLVVDIVRTFPIFYYWKNGKWYITDRLSVKEYKNWEIRKDLKKEFLLTGYVTSNETLLKNVYQVEAGTVVELYSNGDKKIIPYFDYATSELLKLPFERLKVIFKQILMEVFDSLVNELNGRPVVVPLSGGYDSRIIVTMLKMRGYENVICFSYGKIDSFEVMISQKVAKSLGYSWHFVEYTEELFRRIVTSEVFCEYIDYGFNYVSVPHLQDFFAVYELRNRKVIPKDAVFIPGHSGDFFAGTHIFNVNINSTKKKVAQEIYKAHYNLTYTCTNKKYFLQRILHQLKEGLPWTIMEDWDLKNRQAKFIINSLRVYEFFGYEHRVPLWDIRLANFFSKVSMRYKNRNYNYVSERNLYDSVTTRIFSEFNVDCSKYTKKRGFLHIFKKLFRPFLPSRILFYILNNLLLRKIKDVNNFYQLIKVINHLLIKEKILNKNINYNLAKLVIKRFLSFQYKV